MGIKRGGIIWAIAFLIILGAAAYFIFTGFNFKETVSPLPDSANESNSLSNYNPSGNLSSEAEIYGLESRIHYLVNAEREKNGLDKLGLDQQLSDIARKHSEDMVQNDFFEHLNLNGQDPKARAEAAGYRCVKDYGSYYAEGIAENIFKCWTYGSIKYVNDIEASRDWHTAEEIAKLTVESWMNSTSHRENILTASFDREGIGVALSSEGKVLVTEDFC